MISLDGKNTIWHGMPNETPEQELWADNYYDEVLMPRALRRFANRYGKKELPAYYGMILLLGNRWEDLAFNVGLLSPQNIHVICSRENMLQYRQLVCNLQLDEESCICSTVSEGDAASLYRTIKKQHDIWESVGRSAVDITGGDPILQPAAAMAAAVLHMDVYRLAFERKAESRRHEPGTEQMLHIEPVQTAMGL